MAGCRAGTPQDLTNGQAGVQALRCGPVKFVQAMIGAPAEHMVGLAQVAEEAGFDGVALSDHLFLPERIDSQYPYTPDGRPQFESDTPWPDVWVMMGAMAQATEHLRFLTNVFVLPVRNPIAVAKAVGTVATLSDNRVVLGAGAGWMREEFDYLGERFERRGRRMEEMIEVMRALWSGEMVEHHGEFYDFDRIQMLPAPQEAIPVVIGGHSDTALKRAAQVGDGWLGVQYTLDELEEVLARLEGFRRQLGTADRPFETLCSPMVIPDEATCARLIEMGVDTLLTSSWLVSGKDPTDFEQASESLRTYGERFIEPLR